MRKSACGQPKGQLYNHNLGWLMSHNSSGNLSWKWREKSCVWCCISQWILYSTTPIRQQIRASKPWRILKLNFPQRNKGNSLWKRSYRRGFGMGHFFQQILLFWLEYVWMFYTYSLPASARHYVDSIIGDAFICKHCKLHVDIHFTYEDTGP